ncbi:putative ubiquitin-like domain CTD phosphatase 1 [Gregarina niphandrodes]|uniref:Ubiquitin-like domain CTD phosphatase 1 n=1 Tax=Gregarina niphandrodes TaxID=110365 RepID=A0A023BCS0_GRENI|nr:putative ubiquitin-like domain CTD phosphatase 1 [Gregarina niphandrodes]EZG85829.1 putative ubiquitin-like domain CTD phosphatase 1 [Gregarina niphandrodes]|eukprot:XP_011128806.1 putative ubiquitin-like domain CTD phosphatase 1 [Gregarina niphandrodes]
MTGDAFIVLGTPSEEQLQCDNHDHRSCYGYNSKACQERAADYWRSSNVMKVFNSRLKRLRLQWMRTPQPGKKLLVLDIDHTIYDCTNMLKESLHDSCRIRPHLSTMFSSLKEYYDYCLWSQTAWQWIETKCSLIGIYESCQSYPLFILDRSNMFSVGKSSNDQAVEPAAGEIVEVVRRNVKCLRLIWDSCPELYSEKNTLHIDDLHKNFGLNPKNGILVSPYRKANYDTDTELLKLTQYLLRVAKLDDVTTMDHSTWKNT